MGVQSARLAGNRLHLQHGPIDLVIGVDGDCEAAFAAAQVRFETILDELMSEIALLRKADGSKPAGKIAQKMWCAVQEHDGFVTPMAAVAGAVAETVLDAMCQAADMQRAYVNNGGDIALHLQGHATFSVAMAGIHGADLGQITLNADDNVGGIASSGLGGRSLSEGIAQSVTVLAKTASQADAAATLIAGSVDLPNHPGIQRVPANEVVEGSDLGQRPVVAGVGDLSGDEVSSALRNGAEHALRLRETGLIQAASLHLRGQSRQIEMNSRKVLEHA